MLPLSPVSHGVLLSVVWLCRTVLL